MKNWLKSRKADIVNSKAYLYLRENAPTIGLVVGTIGIVAGTIMACKATTKLDDVTEDAKKKLKDIHDCPETEEYTEEEKKHDIIRVYGRFGVDILKLYGPAVVVEASSIALVWAGHMTLKQRNAELAIAYTTLLNSFNEYRNAIKEKYGEDADREARLASASSEDGVLDVSGDDFMYVFDSSNVNWNKDSEANLIFLRSQQSYANNILQLNKYVTLNWVLDRLGLPETDIGLRYGWVYDKDSHGDNFIDFRFKELKDIYGLNESTLVLDFNVDGDISYFLKKNRQKSYDKLKMLEEEIQ